MTDHTRTGRSPAALASMLDAFDDASGAAELRARSYELLAVPPGGRVADVGCGTGRAVAELAERGVQATGIDLDEEMIALARRRWPRGDYRVGDACALPFPDGALDGYRAERLYHELLDPARAVREARRVLAPGGRIVLVGHDWDALVIDSDDPRLTRVIVHARADAVTDPRAARRHRTLLPDAGFARVAVEVHTGVFTDAVMLPLLTGLAETAHAAGAVTRRQADDWLAEQTERAHAGRLFVAVPMFVAAATRP
ncbi:methyltransferase domain-containing protein [Thermomonospora catenispora]|uniref:methyltransferase domain-containing protein n=1 Tax=Thermomonospora catenispora TaxID=2493090 RepID=UPI00111D670E|nr:methyltransferase domain-containing protein [Thermomonospora catenispora]TNY35517.1 methyltransferase domain-containing protein [Thermomonospora catenispora]